MRRFLAFSLSLVLTLSMVVIISANPNNVATLTDGNITVTVSGGGANIVIRAYLDGEFLQVVPRGGSGNFTQTSTLESGHIVRIAVQGNSLRTLTVLYAPQPQLTRLVDNIHVPLVEGVDFVRNGNTFNVFKVHHIVPTNLFLNGQPVEFVTRPFDGVHAQAPNNNALVADPVNIGTHTVALVNAWVTPGTTPTTDTISVTTARTYSNLRTRYNNADVIVEFAFAGGSIVSFNVVDGGHPNNTCWRMFGSSGASLGATPFLQGLIEGGTAFPISYQVAIDAVGAATWSRNALVNAANYAAANVVLP
ncbi:MAG: hypothetical protein FWE21_07735 [Defluviitaleaceae bacterium]|nr:hypothetical protein [Defluviitaleaceae bacterium]